MLLSLKENGFIDVPAEVVKASTPLGAGMGFSQNMCGSLTGAALALGCRFGRRDPGQSRKPSWSRAKRLVERFEKRYRTVSCAEITASFPDFSSSARIQHCMGIIAYVTREAANLLFDPDEGFQDPEKEAYFARREGARKRPQD